MRHILFVCTGNSCRSQIAEAFLNSLAKGRAARFPLEAERGPFLRSRKWEARSAGSKPALKIGETARAVMREVGIELPHTKPKPLSKELIGWADTIITMGCGESCPITGKPATDWGIKYPVGKPIEEYRRARDEIRKKVEELLSA